MTHSLKAILQLPSTSVSRQHWSFHPLHTQVPSYFSLKVILQCLLLQQSQGNIAVPSISLSRQHCGFLPFHSRGNIAASICCNLAACICLSSCGCLSWTLLFSPRIDCVRLLVHNLSHQFSFHFKLVSSGIWDLKWFLESRGMTYEFNAFNFHVFGVLLSWVSFLNTWIFLSFWVCSNSTDQLQASLKA